MWTDTTLQALRQLSPRNEDGFDAWVEQLWGLERQIPETPAPHRRHPPRVRRRLIGLSAAAAGLAGAAVAVALVLTASPTSAHATAKKAVAATAAAASGTITATVSHNGSSYSLDTARWSGGDIAVRRGQRTQLGQNEQLLLIGGGAYLQKPGGSWLHYADVASLGPRLESAAQLAEDDVRGNTAEQILTLATGLTRALQPDGSTIYTGAIPNSSTDSGDASTDDTILRIISSLRSGNEPGAPAGFHTGLQLQMTVGSNGLVDQINLTFQQQGTGSAAHDGSYTWNVTYSRLGSTAAITAPIITTTPAMTTTTPTSTTTGPTTTQTAP